MANKASKSSKSSKSTQPALSPVAAAVAACVASFQPIIAGAISDYTAAQVGMQSRSKNAAEAIKTLYASIADAEARKAAIVEVFGNGERGKANVRGKLAESLPKDAPVSVRSFLAHCRASAASWGTVIVGEDGKTTTVGEIAAERGMRAAYDAAKPKAASDAPKSDAPKAKDVTLTELIAAAIKADGVAAVLGIVESACVASALTLEAARVHETRVALAKK